jgi:hypothetical protein
MGHVPLVFLFGLFNLFNLSMRGGGRSRAAERHASRRLGKLYQMGVTIAIGMPCRSAALVGNLRKTGTLSSAPAECLREFLSIWQRAAAPFALIGSFFYWPLLARSQGPVPIFRANSYLQSIAVEVTDKRGDGVRGLTPADFTLLENGHPQKIAFFGTEEQPISLTICSTPAGA